MTIRALYTATSGMQVQESSLDTIANNIANASTTAFKRGVAILKIFFTSMTSCPARSTRMDCRRPSASSMVSALESREPRLTRRKERSSRPTGNSILQSPGLGFFQVQDPQTGQTLYTRAGNFSINANGQVVLASADLGRPLLPNISIPPGATQITISGDGVVSVPEPPNTNPTQIGNIQTVTFINPQGLIQLGQNLYQQSNGSGTPLVGAPGQSSNGLLQQGYLEASNVDATTELVNLINTQRTYELNSQVVQASDQILQLLTNLRRF